MAKLSSKTQTDETALLALSGGEAVHAESQSSGASAIAGIQLNVSSSGAAIYGESKGGGAGIAGFQTNTSSGVLGAGIYGESRAEGAGVAGFNLVVADPGPSGPGGPGGPGGFFRSEQKEGLVAESKSLTNAAIAGFQNNPTSTGAAIYGEHITGGTAGFFRGNVIVTGDLSFPGADFAEDFTVNDDALAEPGTVMALNSLGEIVPCDFPYERRVVGVIAGAGTFRTGIIMDKRQEETICRRAPVALVGKVFCKVDATYGPIAVGDLLTGSATQGHAMKASDPARAFGAVLGKAMAPLADGVGLIPILISLQ